MSSGWQPGEVIVRREVLGLDPIPRPGQRPHWHGRAWFGSPVHVVEDTDDHLVTFVGPGAEFGYGTGPWPTPDGRHPWHGRTAWSGHGCLMVQRPGDHHAVWHFWTGPERTFACWYINVQTAFVRTPVGYDTQDLELDLVVFPDGTWVLKDLDVVPDRVAEGRFSPALADWIVALGEQLAPELDAQRWWWDRAWADWQPDPAWLDASLPSGWDAADA